MTSPKSIADDGLLSTADVAERLGVHRSTVWFWIKREWLRSEKRGAFHGVSAKALAEFLKWYDMTPSKKERRLAHATQKKRGRKK